MRLPYEIAAPESDPLTFGLIVLQADETIESDFRILMPPNVRLWHSRIPSPPAVTPESLPEMAAEMPRSASLFPPGSRLSVIAYACTSGTAAMGEETVAAQVRKGFPGVTVTNPLSALKATARALRLKRINVVNPYIEEVSGKLCGALGEEGVAVGRIGSFNEVEDRLVARIEPRSILAATLELGSDPDCEAVVISCTNLRACEILQEAEKRLGKPVLASNQALAWHMLRLGGIDAPQPQLGLLGAARLEDRVLA